MPVLPVGRSTHRTQSRRDRGGWDDWARFDVVALSEKRPTTVIVGAGQAGAELAFALRMGGHLGRIVLIGDEVHLPYQRPPLSKSLLAGAAEADAVLVRADRAYEKAEVDLILGRFVTAIDRPARQVHLDDGSQLGYDALALTTGSRPRPFMVGPEGFVADSLYSLDDARSLRAELLPRRRLLVVGGGFIGLELAAVATEAEAAVTLVETRPRLLERTCSASVADYFERLHGRYGVDVRPGRSVRSILRRADGTLAVTLDDAATFTVDRVVAGIGHLPNDALAADAGLAVDDGIVVDVCGRTSDPTIFAAGDCTQQMHGFLQRRVRLESQQNASEQARIVARTIMGRSVVAAAAPTFWSEQYRTKLQMAGLPLDGHEVVRGDPDTGAFSVAVVDDGVLVAIQCVNKAHDFASGRKIIGLRARVDLSRLADADVPLAECLSESGSTATGARCASTSERRTGS